MGDEGETPSFRAPVDSVAIGEILDLKGLGGPDQDDAGLNAPFPEPSRNFVLRGVGEYDSISKAVAERLAAIEPSEVVAF